MSDVSDERDPQDELEQLLDEVGYELTLARSAGLGSPRQMREAVRRAQQRLASADALAAEASIPKE